MVVSFPKRDIGIHVFIDDAGDHGIKVSPQNQDAKGSKWLVIGAIAVNANKIEQIDSWCNTIKRACQVNENNALHYVRLDPSKRLLACQLLATFPIRCFVFCSNKENMRGYHNKRAALASPEKNYFFHSCAKYLLERVSEFGLHQTVKEHKKAKHLSITFDKNDMVPFSRLKIYLDNECRRIEAKRAVHTRRSMKTEVINSGAIKCESDDQCSGLQLADIVAGAFHDATENSKDVAKHDLLPAKALSKVMWTGLPPRKIVANNGVTLFPPYKNSKITKVEKEIFEFFGYYLS